MNYFEHEQKVKYIDGILAKSQDWDWLIEYIENNFEIDFSMNSFDSFRSIYFEIDDIFGYFNSINEYINNELDINEQWLYSIYELSLYYVGRKNYNDLNLSNDFLKVFELLIYLAKLFNETNERKYIIFDEILKYRNLYKLIDISNFVREETEIINRLKSITIDTSKEITILKSNINKEFFNCTTVLSEKHNVILYANCFSYQHIKDSTYNTWEEKYLIDMLNTSYKNGTLEPSFKYTNGTTVPNFNLWTKEILDTMKLDFNNEDADFILESINYILYNNIPSEKVMLKHANLLSEYYDTINHSEDEYKNYSCSSLEILISLFNDKNISFNKNLIIPYNKALHKITSIQKLVEIDSKYPIKDKKLKKKINEYIIEKLSTVDNISDFTSFNNFITDQDIINKSNTDIFQKVSDKFEKVVSDCDGISVASLFVSYFQYLLKIKNNRDVISSDISKEINYIRHLWKEEYLKKSVSDMNTFSNSISVDSSDIDMHNKNIIESPYMIAYHCMILRKEAIIKAIEDITKTPILSLITNIEINDDFPYIPKLIIDERHEIDLCYKNMVENIRKENSYKFFNDFKIDDILPQIYKHIKLNINLNFSMFHKIEMLYNKVKEENSHYLLLEFSETPTLAHLTQLFPMLECKIREMGELFGITPIREDLKHHTKLKEPTSILKKIIFDIYNETQSLEQAADFIFIFFTMFAENGLNIRNSCIHGLSYNIKQNEIAYALKITLFCLNLIEYRFNIIRKNILN